MTNRVPKSHRWTARLTGVLIGLAVPIVGTMAQDGRWIAPGPAQSHALLVDQDNRRWSLDALLSDRPVLVSFFFTGCQTICPTQTAQLALLQAEIARRADTKGPRPLLVSVSLDPYGDTPDSIRAYAARFGLTLGDAGDWLMLTGTPDQLGAVWRAFDQEAADPSQHSSLVWIGQPALRRWTRADVTAKPAELLALLTEGGT